MSITYFTQSAIEVEKLVVETAGGVVIRDHKNNTIIDLLVGTGDENEWVWLMVLDNKIMGWTVYDGNSCEWLTKACDKMGISYDIAV